MRLPPPPLWLSPSLRELINLLGGEGLGGVTVGFVGGGEGVGRVASGAFIVDRLITIDTLPATALALGFKRVIFACPVNLSNTNS